ncbi:hypothetical protein D9V41_11495 [Aeromicrobium phragmitis]|uniref:Uncharacterized protein n=1 Tax=Aeromicrobium phragmitis TaxID=2478914 RepID=A0A3L8PKX6_9ACTN|nr:hypothetical protein [Aeromicrobium phragmitis]RLV55373.1 hypothetical protein D9V41_11495 [Aeromicrobium phragmitis]
MSESLPVHREDGELVGFLTEGDGRWTAATVFGYPLSEHETREDGEDALVGKGLSYLAERWAVQRDDVWMRAELVEASPSHVTVQLVDMSHPDRYGERVELAAPVTTGLRLER